MKIMTVLGTRPEIIRLSLVIPLLDSNVNHVLVHTGQNFEDSLNGVFFRELDLRAPDVFLGVRASSFADQAGQILRGAEEALLAHKPDRLLILGDTNSGLSAIVARRLGIPVYHMEAGNRCYDDRVPEEVNRRVIDHASSVLLPYTSRSRENLLREGIAGERIFVVGNPIKQVMDHYSAGINGSTVMSRLGLEPGRYFLVTMHRAENVDREDKLRDLVDGLSALHAEFGHPVVCSFHPRTRSKVERFGVQIDREGLRFVEPPGFCDFMNLERSAACIISDSGTVQEEGCILGVPNVTIREVTERPETLECGSNVLASSDPALLVTAVRLVTRQVGKWVPPPEYLAPAVAETVCRIVIGFSRPDAAETEWKQGRRLDQTDSLTDKQACAGRRAQASRTPSGS